MVETKETLRAPSSCPLLLQNNKATVMPIVWKLMDQQQIQCGHTFAFDFIGKLQVVQ